MKTSVLEKAIGYSSDAISCTDSKLLRIPGVVRGRVLRVTPFGVLIFIFVEWVACCGGPKAGYTDGFCISF